MTWQNCLFVLKLHKIKVYFPLNLKINGVFNCHLKFLVNFRKIMNFELRFDSKIPTLLFDLNQILKIVSEPQFPHLQNGPAT